MEFITVPDAVMRCMKTVLGLPVNEVRISKRGSYRCSSVVSSRGQSSASTGFYPEGGRFFEMVLLIWLHYYNQTKTNISSSYEHVMNSELRFRGDNVK